MNKLKFFPLSKNIVIANNVKLFAGKVCISQLKWICGKCQMETIPNQNIIINIYLPSSELIFPNLQIGPNKNFALRQPCSNWSEMGFLAHLWGAYAIPVALSVVRRSSYVVCVHHNYQK